jgi:SP family myo-inositol transporter-like MFS transporter 13
MSSAEEPLISRRPSPSGDHLDDNNDDDHANSHDDTGAGDHETIPPASPTLFIYLLTLSAGISGLLFGCTPLPVPSPPIPHPSPLSQSVS